MVWKVKWYEMASVQWLVMLWLLTEASSREIYRFENDLFWTLWILWFFFVCLTLPLCIILNALKPNENIQKSDTKADKNGENKDNHIERITN